MKSIALLLTALLAFQSRGPVPIYVGPTVNQVQRLACRNSHHAHCVRDNVRRTRVAGRCFRQTCS